MANPQANYPVGFYFELSFKGEDAAFQEVSGLSKEFQTEEVWGGGENRFKYRLPTVTTSQNLVLKRAIISSGSKLMNWCANTLDQGFAANIQPNNVTLNLLNLKDDKKNVLMKWTFHNAYPIKYNISEFKSTGNDVVVESIELAYTYFQISTDTSFSGLF